MGNPPQNSLPITLVIFGATGDLASRKLIPALFYLYQQEQLPDNFSVVGYARRPLSHDNFRELAKKSLEKKFDLKKETKVEEFLQIFTYQQGMFDQDADYERLADTLKSIEASKKTKANHLYYLAVPPEHYEGLLNNLHRTGLMKSGINEESWDRIAVEKPFGSELANAEKLDKMLGTLFTEHQVYRIDHYLAKEVLQNVVVFRFANNILGDIWNNQYVEKIEIKLLEDIDIEGRAAFYEGVGALLDVGQNHLLQMLALITMDNPGELRADFIREERARILGHLRVPTFEEVKESTIRAQYKGYTDEEGVDNQSQVETYFKVKAFINNPRWQGVPITLESGKKFSKVDKSMVVTMRHPAPCLCPPSMPNHLKNRIYFYIQPKPGIKIDFWSKKPGTSMELEKKSLEFYYDADVSGRYLNEYAKLVLDVISGDQTLFVSSGEALAAWKFIDPIITAWRKGAVPMQTYINSPPKPMKQTKFVDTDQTQLPF